MPDPSPGNTPLREPGFPPLAGIKVWISGAIPGPERWGKRKLDAEIREFVAALSSRILDCGGSVLHVADPRADASFTPVLFEEAQRFADEHRIRGRVTLGISRSWSKTRREEVASWQSCCRLVETEEERHDDVTGGGGALTASRLAGVASAFVAVGGAGSGALQRDFELARERGLPCFLVGGFGGSVADFLESTPHALEGLKNGLSREANRELAGSSDADAVATEIVDQLCVLFQQGALTRSELTDGSAIPAHALWVELATRIATQRLHYRSGDEETAVASVVSLFKTTRELMERHPEARGFHRIALRLLNETLRPCAARWHSWMTRGNGDAADKNGNPPKRFRDEWVRRKFREELRDLQPRLLGYQKAFGAMSRGGPIDPRWLEPELHEGVMASLREECRSTAAIAALGDDLYLNFRPQVPLRTAEASGRGQRDIAPEVLAAERAAILARRVALARNGARGSQGGATDVINPTGLALSGGGIRSATFCLGILQGLQRHGMFTQFDYLSTVSGGGYIGSFISSYLGTNPEHLDRVERVVREERGKAPSRHTTLDRVTGVEVRDDAAASLRQAVDAEAELREKGELARRRIAEAFQTPESGGSESQAIRHLRNHSRYLLAGGGWGLVRIAGVFLFGFVTSLLMLLTLPLLAAWVVLAFHTTPLVGWGRTCLWISLIALGVLWLVLPLSQRLAHGATWDSRPGKWRSVIETLALLAGLAVLLFGAIQIAPSVVEGYERLRSAAAGFALRITSWKPPEYAVAVLASGVPAVFGALIKRGDGTVRRWAQWLFNLTAPAFFILAFLVFASHMGVAGDGDWSLVWVALVTILLVAWAWLFLNVNTFAPHRYYRDRLCECYLAIHGRHQRSWLKRQYDRFFHGVPDRGPTDHVEGVGTLQRLPLTALGANAAAPYHLINATLNAEASRSEELRGRNGDFFIFSRHFCGSPLTGYIPTEDLEKVDPHVDLGTAMAISAAAASTNMGWKTMRRLRFFMTLFNVRLGYWMRRPGSTGLWGPFEGPGPYYFICEMLGAVHERRRYVNLSDGGHIENLAAYELLRRQCKFIVCVDAGMEPGMECSDLMRLQRYAAIDFGIRLHFDPTDLTLLPTNFSRAYAVLVKIDYAPEKRAPGREASTKLGWMLYIKLALTGVEPRYVLDYRRQNPDFPHQTTADQLYDEAQFEAYRALGECAAESLFRSEIIGSSEPEDLESWFRALASSLLPDNDEVFSSNGSGFEARHALVC